MASRRAGMLAVSNASLTFGAGTGAGEAGGAGSSSRTGGGAGGAGGGAGCGAAFAMGIWLSGVAVLLLARCPAVEGAGVCRGSVGGVDVAAPVSIAASVAVDDRGPVGRSSLATVASVAGRNCQPRPTASASVAAIPSSAGQRTCRGGSRPAAARAAPMIAASSDAGGSPRGPIRASRVASARSSGVSASGLRGSGVVMGSSRSAACPSRNGASTSPFPGRPR